MTGILHVTVKFQKNSTVVMVIVKLDFFEFSSMIGVKGEGKVLIHYVIRQEICHTIYTKPTLSFSSFQYCIIFRSLFILVSIMYFGIHITRCI